MRHTIPLQSIDFDSSGGVLLGYIRANLAALAGQKIRAIFNFRDDLPVTRHESENGGELVISLPSGFTGSNALVVLAADKPLAAGMIRGGSHGN